MLSIHPAYPKYIYLDGAYEHNFEGIYKTARPYDIGFGLASYPLDYTIKYNVLPHRYSNML
jgi:hypothetical protein